MGKKTTQSPPPLGRLTEVALRGMIAAIRRAMRDPAVTPKDLLRLLAHQERLARELKTVTTEKLKARIAALNNGSTSQSEQLD